MVYTTIFEVKPKKENKKEFCKRIVRLLNEIYFYNDGCIDSNGHIMLNIMFKYSKLNNGYADIDDLLNESNKNYENIFNLCYMSNDNIEIENVLANIDIIINCIYYFQKNAHRYFCREADALKIIDVIFKAINQFLLSNGYKVEYNDENKQAFIVQNEIAINIEDIEDKKLKSNIISFYDYKNSNDIEEKKKILLILAGQLESQKKDIKDLFGTKIQEMLNNYVNNLNIRHNNIDKEYKKCYNKTIAELSDEEMLGWYDYIFAFMLNIYLNLKKLKNININNGYQ
jgi:hypothetical protein